MPIFEFRCLDCSEKFEDLFSSHDISNEDIKCPKCGSKDVKRIFSLFSSPGVTVEDSCSTCNAPTCSSCSK